MDTSLFSADIFQAIFNTLVHSLWQIPLIALFIKLIVQRFKSTSKQVNYNVNLSAILMSIIVAGFTFTYYMLKSAKVILIPESEAVSSIELLPILPTGTDDALTTSSSWAEWFIQADVYIVLFWSIGATLLLSRIVMGWIGLRYLRKDLNYTIPDHLTSIFKDVQNQLSLNRHVKLAISKTTNVPMVIGHIRPIILLPFATINQLSTQEIEAILAHELAHIIQFDYLKNLIVMIGESIFFYHPVIWMLSNEIKEDREHICDDQVMSLYPNRIQYAKTLVKLEEIYKGNNSGLSIALFSNKFKLMNRVKRILNMKEETRTGTARAVLITLFLCSIIVFSSAETIFNNTSIDTIEQPEKQSMWDLLNITPPPAPPAPLAPPAMKGMATPPAPPAPPAPPSFRFSDDFIIMALDTIDDEEREKLKQELREKRSEYKKRVKETRDRLKSELKEELKIGKKEMKALKEKLGKDDHSFHLEMDDEELEEWGEKMGAWGERFGAKIANTFDSEWAEDMEKWGEEFGAKMEKEWGEDFSFRMEEIGEDLSEIMDDEWLEGINEMSREMVETFDEEWLEDIANIGEEVALALEDEFEHITDAVNGFERSWSYGNNRDAQTKLRLRNALKDDDLVRASNNKVIITDDEMSVNGQVQSSEVLKRYQRLIRRSNENAFEKGNTRVEFTFDDDEMDGKKNSRLRISVDY